MTEKPVTNTAEKVFQNMVSKLELPNDFVAFEEIFSPVIPHSITAFVSAELTFSARAALSSIKSARFDFQDEILRDARAAFAYEVVKTTRLRKEEFLKLLQSATHLQAQYLARPQKILKDLIFADQPERTVREIQDRLTNFKDYIYLLDVFAQYLERKKPESLSAEKFEKVISEIDSRICLSYSNEDFFALFKPLYDFYLLANETAVELQTLMDFLSEKKTTDYLARLDLAKQNGIAALTLETLNELLLASPEIFQTQQEQPKENETQISKTERLSTARQSEFSQSNTSKKENEELTLPQPSIANEPTDIQENHSSKIENLEPKSDEAPLPTPQPPTKLEIPQVDFFELAKQEIRAQKKDDAPNLPDIHSLISSDERKGFIKRLFKGNEEEYNLAISIINEKKTWREASLYIDHEVFSKFKVDEFSSEAVAFIDIVFERFQVR